MAFSTFFHALLVASIQPILINGQQYSTISGHSCFRNIEGMQQTMFDLANEYPKLVTITDIGDSYIKTTGDSNEFGVDGYDIYAMNITAADSVHPSSAKGKTLITSGVHAREYAPPELAMRFAEKLINGYDEDPDITWILQHTEVHFIIHVNPDGRYVAENYRDLSWRKNLKDRDGCNSGEDYGVDINRNFDFNWGDRDGASNDPCASDFHGDFPESEPETQAVASYARSLFPASQRRNNPLSEPAGEDAIGMHVDIHSSGGYVYFPWGHADKRSPDDDALQALGRKIAYYNGYDLWAPGSPDFLYPASGDTSDYMYGALSTASYGLELGEDFYEDCGLFEAQILPDNMPGLLYGAMISKRPFFQVKGPDIIDLSSPSASLFSSETLTVTAVASDSERADGQATGDQGVTSMTLYLDVHPDDFTTGDVSWEMIPAGVNSGSYTFNAEIVLPKGLSSGRHTLFAQAEDSDGYQGPARAVFFDVERSETASPSKQPTLRPTVKPTPKPTPQPSLRPTNKPTTMPPIPPFTAFTSPPTSLPTRRPTTSPSNKPTNNPSSAPTENPTVLPTTSSPTPSPSVSPTSSPVLPTAAPSSNPSNKPSSSPVNAMTTPSPTSQSSTDAPSRPPQTFDDIVDTLDSSVAPDNTDLVEPDTESASYAALPSFAVATLTALVILYLM